MMRIGAINYINFLPVMHALDTAAWDVVPGAPSALNALLAEGAIDASPISSIEYARHQDDYVLLPDLSISCRGPVRSVMLFSSVPPEALDSREVGICRSTATSRVLLRILLENYFHVRPRYREDASVEQARSGALPAVLLIGDEALAFRQAARRDPALAAFREYDLGTLWADQTSLPMVFAVYALRRDRMQAEGADTLARALRVSRDAGVGLPRELLDSAAARTGMSHGELRTYYGGLHYSLGAVEERALLTFYRHAASMGMCPPCERIQFLALQPHLGGQTSEPALINMGFSQVEEKR